MTLVRPELVIKPGRLPKKGSTPKNTMFSYLYRDADNYKVSKSVVFPGRLTATQMKEIENAANASFKGSFIPYQVGLPHLHNVLKKWDTEPNDADHPYHDILAVTKTTMDPTTEVSAEDFYKKFLKVSGEGWDELIDINKLED